MFIKKFVYNKLVAKVDNIDTSDFVLKTKYNTDKIKFPILVIQQQKLPELLLKIKYLVLVIQLKKKQTIIRKLHKLKIKLLILVIQKQKLH